MPTLHAAIAKILHLTGAGEIIEHYLEDWEEIQVLASDGQDFGLIACALNAERLSYL